MCAVSLLCAGSPFYCALIDGKKATATGDGLKKCARGKTGRFHVDTVDVGEAELLVTMLCEYIITTAALYYSYPVNIVGLVL